MKQWLFLLAACLFAPLLSFAQNKDSEKTLVKTLDPKDAQFVSFEMPPFVQVGTIKKWPSSAAESNTLRIELEIHANMDETILARLIKANRYAFDGILKDNDYVISAPSLSKSVSVGGVDLQETIFMNITAPKNYVFDTKSNRFSRDVSDMAGRGKSAEYIRKMSRFTKIEVTVKLVPTATANAAKKSSNRNATDDVAPSNLTKDATAGDAPKKAQMIKPNKDGKYGDILIDDVPIPFE